MNLSMRSVSVSRLHRSNTKNISQQRSSHGLSGKRKGGGISAIPSVTMVGEEGGAGGASIHSEVITAPSVCPPRHPMTSPRPLPASPREAAKPPPASMASMLNASSRNLVPRFQKLSSARKSIFVKSDPVTKFNDEEEQSSQNTTVSLFYPHSSFIIIWDKIILWLSIFDAIRIPLFICFGIFPMMGDSRYACHWLIYVVLVFNHVFILADIVIMFRRPIVINIGQHEKNIRVIRRSYLKTWFWWDFIALIEPSLLLPVILGMEGIPRRFYSIWGLLRVPRILKIRRQVKRVSSGLAGIFFWVGAFAYLAHVFGCVWWLIGVIQQDSLFRWTLNYEDKDVLQQYVTCLYWALQTMSTVGYGEIYPNTLIECAYVIVVFVFGALSYAVIFGYVSLSIERLDARERQFAEMMSGVDSLLRFYEVQPEVACQVRDNVVYFWNVSGGHDIRETLELLPLAIQTDVAFRLYGDKLKRIKVLTQCSQGFLRHFSLKLQPLVALPNQFIFKAGDTGTQMYLIIKGSLQILAADEQTVFDHVSEGQLVGESVVFGSTVTRRSAGLRSLTHSELCMIDRADVMDVVDLFPEELSKIKKAVEIQGFSYKVNHLIKSMQLDFEVALTGVITEEEMQQIKDCEKTYPHYVKSIMSFVEQEDGQWCICAPSKQKSRKGGGGRPAEDSITRTRNFSETGSKLNLQSTNNNHNHHHLHHHGSYSSAAERRLPSHHSHQHKNQVNLRDEFFVSEEASLQLQALEGATKKIRQQMEQLLKLTGHQSHHVDYKPNTKYKKSGLVIFSPEKGAACQHAKALSETPYPPIGSIISRQRIKAEERQSEFDIVPTQKNGETPRSKSILL